MTPAFLTFNEVAERLGVAPGTLRKALPDMVRSGFPRRNTIFKRFPAAGVEAWINDQSRIADDPATVTPPKQSGVNLHAL
jgi:DNA-binding transcriptional regulator YhcF (GntR family)